MADRTELWIAQQMQHLMQEKPLSRIRTTEICERAEIERSTFYYHFKDKYDCAAWMFYHQAHETNGPDAVDLNRLRNSVILNNGMLNDASRNVIWQYLQEYYVDAYASKAMGILHTDALDAQLLFSIRLYCCGAVSIIR